MVEEYRPNVVQVAIEREQTPPRLVAPDLDLVIITTGYEQRLRLVEIYSSHGSIVFFEAINECSHAIIPELDR